MSDGLRRLEGERVFCHQCNNEWDRSRGGLTCPRCNGDFTEIVSPIYSGRNHFTDSPQLSGQNGAPEEEDLFPGQRAASPPRHRYPFDSPSPDQGPLSDPFRRSTPFDDHNPWADVPDPEEGDISTFQFSTPGGGRGTFSFTSRTYASRGQPFAARAMTGPQVFPFGPMSAFGSMGGPGNGGFNNDPMRRQGPMAQPADMQDLFSVIMQSMQAANLNNTGPNGERATRGGFFLGGGTAGNRPPGPFELLTAILNPGGAGRHGDMVWSQEHFDRILEQLAEQGNTAPPPASEDAIKNLPKKKMNKEMMGDDGQAECSICMDNVEMDAEVTTLPCNHWFHEECVVAWLKEHDTCPHCRKPITNPENNQNQPSGSPRLSRRSTHLSDTMNGPGGDGTRENPWSVPASPSSIRDARNRYYGRRSGDRDREPSRRSSSPRRQSQPEQYYGGRHESTEYYTHRPEPSRHSSRRHSRHDPPSSSGGGVTGWIRNHLPGGGGSR
ncbi:uncharacterized protein HMPREF1541_00071 [Cyphellophora europaea CBS 101466]|uniref:RING-type E3 ubiquitin transferase n=1 Tax=Cyphellophora europaea (strain CBS 101466) TaxID=1220924 RepID=W2SBB8_CYPE1|nr:uncharacterized protein HMPREF1541_00071 [Cyphellophora europaea CBS 101466]ETN45890.1 hypothetical protein HMPREF1541_00071 [Cyphellophora europaea CBS 101466]